MTFLKKLDFIFVRIETWIIISFLWMMVIFTFVQVCLRGLYTHGHILWANSVMGQIDWSEPFARLLLLWLTFLGAALVTNENRHIRIDILGALLPDRWLPVREVILSLVCVFVSGIMVKVSVNYVYLEMQYGETLFGRIPAWLGEIIMPIGFFLILFHFLIRAITQAGEALRRQRK